MLDKGTKALLTVVAACLVCLCVAALAGRLGTPAEAASAGDWAGWSANDAVAFARDYPGPGANGRFHFIALPESESRGVPVTWNRYILDSETGAIWLWQHNQPHRFVRVPLVDEEKE
jgi:hypothetical protein